MVSIAIESLSAPPATSNLTINHDVAADLDSTTAFEGPEKLLEVWFATSPSNLPSGVPSAGLKVVPAETWVGMLDMVNCKILSILKSEAVDAYLLSESSMFVFPHKLILKTCGTTTLLLGLQRLLHIAAEYAGFPFEHSPCVQDKHATAIPYRVFYSRKNFLFPDRQQGPHRSWSQEVKYLDDLFEDGSAYMVGKMNGDHWYLYVTSPNKMLTPPLTPDSETIGRATINAMALGVVSRCPTSLNLPDETLEILMTDLDPENAQQFYLSYASAVARKQMPAKKQLPETLARSGELSPPRDQIESADFNEGDIDTAHNLEKLPLPLESLSTEGHALGAIVSESCGLSGIYPASAYPDARIDAYLFSPCGFSANGIIPASQAVQGSQKEEYKGQYFTVHVTPEPGFSYASFETNVPGNQDGRPTQEIIEHVVGIFRPGRFSVTLFEAKGRGCNDYGAANAHPETSAYQKLADPIHGYRRVDRIVHDFDDYDLVFRFYERDDWVTDKRARVGEIL